MNAAPVLAVGAVLGAGVLLVASPRLWPTDAVKVRAPDGIRSRLRTRMTLAGVGSLPPTAFVILSIVAGLAAAGLMQAVTGVAALAVAVGVLMFAAPTLGVAWRARSRQAEVRAVWPDVVDHLVSAVRAGVALPDAVAALATTGPAAARPLFAGFADDYRATGTFGPSLDRLKDAAADPVADRLVETLRMAREVGGSDLIAVLRALAAYLREDAAVRAELAARQSWVVNAARLGVVAPWIVLLLLATRPEGAAAYNSPAGSLVIGIGAIVSAAAYLLMLRIGRLPEEQRWFR